MRDRYDAMSKDALVELLGDVGAVVRGADAGSVSQRVDVLFTPDAEHHRERRERGLLGALVDDVVCDLCAFSPGGVARSCSKGYNPTTTRSS